MDAGVALVTGASRGVGAAVALRPARAGYSVLVNYSADATGAASVVQDIRDGGGVAVAHQADVSDPAAIGPMFDRAAGLGTLAAVINNAGITGNLIGNLVDVPPGTIQRVVGLRTSIPQSRWAEAPNRTGCCRDVAIVPGRRATLPEPCSPLPVAAHRHAPFGWGRW